MKDSSTKRLVPAVIRAAAILETLRTSSTALTSAAIAESTGLPRTTVHELVHTLLHLSYVVSEPEGSLTYQLGPALLTLGYRYQKGLDLAREGHEVATSIATESGDTVQIATLHGTEVLYVAKVDSASHVRLVSDVGGRLPAHLTAVGKALLSSLTGDDLRARFPEGVRLAALTPNSITERDVLFRDLEKVRQAGVAFEFRESNPDVGCVAAPVRDRAGNVVAALSIAALMTRFGPEETAQRTNLAKQGAAELSHRLGWPGEGSEFTLRSK
ncbi:IclR family transcriptional regulator [Homoserinimonas sp. OAct 916]|uniref:IclR family transcriptional regulator n=1 Tax=Homoserinimonas sp. OAct 916 TaxID=2211450 RepID=UPI000DBE10B6|nr:IclR family transcriptional regulator [Homoserinimonas sp. OAct 916]